MAKKYMRCSVCGQIIEVIKDTKAPIICCGEPMEELFPHTEEGGVGEKHIPVFKIKDRKVDVQIGSILHPSTTDHYIEWIALETSKGSQVKDLKPGDSPEALFSLTDGEMVKSIYAYCNIHELWKITVKEKGKPCGCKLDME